jgi:hypothetical protein
MSLATTITNLLTGMTLEKLRAMERADRQALADQLRRVYGIIEGDRIVEDAREATALREGVLRRLADGERSL